MVILITVDAIANPPRILTMLFVRIPGSQLRAGPALASLSIEDVAARAQLCRHSIRKWETSSHVHVANGFGYRASLTPTYEPRQYEQESRSAKVSMVRCPAASQHADR
jgi:hypothetical protein